MRGQLTEEVQNIAIKELKRPLNSIAELRLLPYLDYVMKNNMKLNPFKLNEEDRQVLSDLKKEGHIKGGINGLLMTKEFYDAIQQILWQGYVVQGAIQHNEEDKLKFALMMEE